MKQRVYKSEASRESMDQLYDRQLHKLQIESEDLFVDTRHGKTHLIKTGNRNGKPLLLFHGGNSTTPYYLRNFLFLLDEYLIYAVDTIGHPGKSAETVLSAKNMDYGNWASDVIEQLNYDRMICAGGSYGAGILMKLMCVSPEKIEKAVVLVPSGIRNALPLKTMKMAVPMLLYTFTKNEAWLKKAILPMAIDAAHIDVDTLEMVKYSFDHVVVKTSMPSDVPLEKMKSFHAPVLLFAGEHDILFPGNSVVKRAKIIMPHCKTCLIEGSGHMFELSPVHHKIMTEFLADE